jgi:S1-C subfamily serine protease
VNASLPERTCPACGATSNGNAFCTECGHPLGDVGATRSEFRPARIYIHSGPDRGADFELTASRTVVGRGREADAKLNDPLVSSRHLAVAPLSTGVLLEDLQSANGTVADGDDIRPGHPTQVPFGTFVHLGGTVAEFVAPGAEPQSAAPTITRSDRTSIVGSRRGRVLVAGGATISLLALVVGALAFTRDSSSPPASPANVAPSSQRDASWVMRTQSHSALQVFACEGSSESRCDDTLQGGTGSVLDLGDGLILTNFHVIADEDNELPLDDLWVAVSVADEDYVRAEVVGFSACDDLAVLRTAEDAGALNLAEVTLGDASSLEIGDQVVVLGYPGTVATAVSGDQQLQLTAGNVSALDVVVDNYRDLIQMSAPINHGNSGGPVFDLDGTQIGVATLGDANDTQGIFYAISIDRVTEVLPDLTDGIKQTGLDSCPS